MKTFTALGYRGEIASRILKDGTLEQCYSVRINLEIFEYRDLIAKADSRDASSRIGELRRRAIVRRIEMEMRKRGIVRAPNTKNQ